MQVRFARSASKHRIARTRILHVIEHCGLRFEQPPPAGGQMSRTTRLLYFGDDADGIRLEVMAVELASGDLLVIHAMLLQDRYLSLYEEAKKWRNL